MKTIVTHIDRSVCETCNKRRSNVGFYVWDNIPSTKRKQLECLRLGEGGGNVKNIVVGPLRRVLPSAFVLHASLQISETPCLYVLEQSRSVGRVFQYFVCQSLITVYTAVSTVCPCVTLSVIEAFAARAGYRTQLEE